MMEITFNIGVLGFDNKKINYFFDLHTRLFDNLNKLKQPGNFSGVYGFIILIN